MPVIRKYALTQEESGIYRAPQALPTSLIRCSIIKTRAKKANLPLRVSRHGVAEGILKEPYVKGESVRPGRFTALAGLVEFAENPFSIYIRGGGL